MTTLTSFDLEFWADIYITYFSHAFILSPLLQPSYMILDNVAVHFAIHGDQNHTHAVKNLDNSYRAPQSVTVHAPMFLAGSIRVCIYVSLLTLGCSATSCRPPTPRYARFHPETGLRRLSTLRRLTMRILTWIPISKAFDTINLRAAAPYGNRVGLNRLD